MKDKLTQMFGGKAKKSETKKMKKIFTTGLVKGKVTMFKTK